MLGDMTDTQMLALVIYREARGETRAAQATVGWSILARVRKGGWWGNTIQEVIEKPWQYSSITAPHDPQYTGIPLTDGMLPGLTDAAYMACLDVATAILGNTEPNTLPDADSYYDTSTPPPKWATGEGFRGQVGRLRFYDTRPSPGVAA